MWHYLPCCHNLCHKPPLPDKMIPRIGFCQPLLCPLLLEQFQLVFFYASTSLESFIALLKPLILVTFRNFICYFFYDRLLFSKVSSCWYISRVMLSKYILAVKQTSDKLHNNPYLNFLSNYFSHISVWFDILVNGLENVRYFFNTS